MKSTMKCKLQKKQKNPATDGELPGVMKEFMMNNLFYLYHTKMRAQGYEGQKTKNLKN